MLSVDERRACRAVQAARPEISSAELEQLAEMVLPVFPAAWLERVLRLLADVSRRLGYTSLVNAATREFARRITTVAPDDLNDTVAAWLRWLDALEARRDVLGETLPGQELPS